MMRPFARIPIALKALRELGPNQVFWYIIYQTGLRSGAVRWATSSGPTIAPGTLRSPFHQPERTSLERILGDRIADLRKEADEVAAGQVRLFGGAPVPLQLAPPNAGQHWTHYEGHPERWGVEDVKFFWEPARFGWVYPLGRAYAVSGEEKYPAAFWEHWEAFQQNNPPYQGPNWASAQEVALRLMALLFAANVFEPSTHSTPKHMSCLAGAVAAHARRIPPTISYARAQNNNHRISEALGLIAAGWSLPEHPSAKQWTDLGWRELNRALQSQIHEDGVYAQHSANYHRLMLHAALQAMLFGQTFPENTQRLLSAATAWLLAQVDPSTGRVPNLGSNDGAHILPLASAAFQDFRPVLQAAARAFLNRPAFPPGPWDETGLWLGQSMCDSSPLPVKDQTSPAVPRLGNAESWGTLRAVHFRERPSHADQLHVDLWWRGENIAMDAGTYRYTAAQPWDNSLAQTLVHNTIKVQGQNQMRRAGRFLWLDWAQAELLDTSSFSVDAVAAQHGGYLHLGVLHRRVLKRSADHHWQVIDHLLRGRSLHARVLRNPVYRYRLHWLLPDWPWTLSENVLTLDHPQGGQVRLAVSVNLPSSPDAHVEEPSLVRAGEALIGPQNVAPILGWYSPTYNLKVPALSFSFIVHSPMPLTIFSDWTLEPSVSADSSPATRASAVQGTP